MEALQIALADGRTAYSDKLNTYFASIFDAEDSGDEFPVELSHIWAIGYSRKDAAVRALEKNFMEGVDFQKVHQLVELSGQVEHVYKLSVSCLEYFVVRANRAVFEVYRECRKAVRQVVQLLPRDLPSALRLAANLAEEKERLQLQIQQNAPKVAFADNVAVSENALSFAAAAKWLKIPGLEGRNKLVKRLKQDKILLASREPYQSYIDAGYFEVEPQTFKAGEKGKRLAGTTRVTGKGLDWLVKRYKLSI